MSTEQIIFLVFAELADDDPEGSGDLLINENDSAKDDLVNELKKHLSEASIQRGQLNINISEIVEFPNGG